MIANFIQGKGHDTLIKGISILKKKDFLYMLNLLEVVPMDRNHLRIILEN